MTTWHLKRKYQKLVNCDMLRNIPMFGKSPKKPADVVKALKEAINSLEKGDKKAEKSQEEVSKNLILVKDMLIGNTYTEQQCDSMISKLAQELYSSNLVLLLIKNLNRIDFEAKKDVAKIFSNIIRRQIGTRSPTVEYICTKPEILFMLLSGYDHDEVALNSGMMLRECFRYESLAKIVLDADEFYNFFTYIEMPAFHIASDAFSSFKELLTRHKTLCARFLDTNFDKLFTHYQPLLNSDNYATRRQSVKLLAELLLDSHNFKAMARYVSNSANLKVLMNMLKDRSRNIQIDAFHVFKIFVANPVKPNCVFNILMRNQGKLIEFLLEIHTGKPEDDQFNEEIDYVISQIKNL